MVSWQDSSRPFLPDSVKNIPSGMMARLRRYSDGTAFAFDPRRHAVLCLSPGINQAGSEKRFYEEPIRKADKRFDAHLGRLKQGRKQL